MIQTLHPIIRRKRRSVYRPELPVERIAPTPEPDRDALQRAMRPASAQTSPPDSTLAGAGDITNPGGVGTGNEPGNTPAPRGTGQRRSGGGQRRNSSN